MDTPMLPPAGASFYEMATGHFGLVGWAAALLVFRKGSRRSRREVVLLVLLALGFATAILLWPVFDLFFVLPGIKLMLPLRFFTWVGFAGSAIAAFEVDHLVRDVEDGRATGRAFLVPAGVLIVLAAAFLATLAPLHAAAGALRIQRLETVGAMVFLAAGVALAVALSGRKTSGAFPFFPIFLAVAAAGELFWQGRRLYRLGPAGDFYPPTPLVEFLRRQPGPFRVLGEGPVIFPGTNAFAGVEDVRSHDPVERRDYVEWLDRACGYDPKAYFKHVTNVDCVALDFLNVKYLVATPGRATPGPRWRPVYSGTDGTVYENGSVRPRISPVEPDAARVSDYRETTNTVRFRSDAPVREAVLVASLMQDGGWRARDESGKLLPVSRANGPFLAVTVPRGDHRVSLTYTPPGARAGAAVSLASLALAATATLFARRKRRSPARL